MRTYPSLVPDFPFGPLAEPRTAWRKGRGKIHVSATCRRAGEATEHPIVLTATAHDDLCSLCADDLDADERTHLQLAERLDDWIDTLDGLTDGRYGYEAFYESLLTMRWNISHHGLDDYTDANPAVWNWARTHIAPRVEAALETAERNHPIYAPPRWEARSFSRPLGDDHTSLPVEVWDHEQWPALVDATALASWRRSTGGGHDALPSQMRLMVNKLLATGQPMERLRVEAHKRLGELLEQYPIYSSINQVDLDAPPAPGVYATLRDQLLATWKGDQLDQATRLLDRFLDHVADLEQQMATAPRVLVVAKLWRLNDMPRTLMLRNAVAVAQPLVEGDTGGWVMSLVPESTMTTEYVERTRTRSAVVFGPVEESDTQATWESAVDIYRFTDNDAETALALARAVTL